MNRLKGDRNVFIEFTKSILGFFPRVSSLVMTSNGWQKILSVAFFSNVGIFSYHVIKSLDKNLSGIHFDQYGNVVNTTSQGMPKPFKEYGIFPTIIFPLISICLLLYILHQGLTRTTFKGDILSTQYFSKSIIMYALIFFTISMIINPIYNVPNDSCQSWSEYITDITLLKKLPPTKIIARVSNFSIAGIDTLRQVFHSVIRVISLDDNPIKCMITDIDDTITKSSRDIEFAISYVLLNSLSLGTKVLSDALVEYVITCSMGFKMIVSQMMYEEMKNNSGFWSIFSSDSVKEVAGDNVNGVMTGIISKKIPDFVHILLGHDYDHKISPYSTTHGYNFFAPVLVTWFLYTWIRCNTFNEVKRNVQVINPMENSNDLNDISEYLSSKLFSSTKLFSNNLDLFKEVFNTI